MLISRKYGKRIVELSLNLQEHTFFNFEEKSIFEKIHTFTNKGLKTAYKKHIKYKNAYCNV